MEAGLKYVNNHFTLQNEQNSVYDVVGKLDS